MNERAQSPQSSRTSVAEAGEGEAQSRSPYRAGLPEGKDEVVVTSPPVDPTHRGPSDPPADDEVIVG